MEGESIPERRNQADRKTNELHYLFVHNLTKNAQYASFPIFRQPIFSSFLWVHIHKIFISSQIFFATRDGKDLTFTMI